MQIPRIDRLIDTAAARRLPTLSEQFATRLAGATAVLFVLLVAGPHPAPAQGIVRGAQEGAYEGNRVAGPVGGVVGGAVGAGVGGAVGAVEGVFGVPHHAYHHHYRCRGYYDSYGYYHCFN